MLFFSLLFAFLTPTYAVITAENNISSGYYRIKAFNSNKYFDIKDESTENGAELQIWDYFPLHQNQVFYFQKTEDYWKIYSCNTSKSIEVRDSRTDDGAPVAQWDYANLPCQQWYLIFNDDNTVSIKNKNSGKYLDVSGNNTSNGTKIIQYEPNGTSAQKFILEKLNSSDIYNAAWKKDISSIEWLYYPLNSSICNGTPYVNSNNTYSWTGSAPAPGKTYLISVEYIDSNTVLNLICDKTIDKSTIEQLKDLISGECKEEAVAKVLEKCGVKVPGVGIAIGVADILISSTDPSSEEWKNFINSARQNKNDGSVNPVIKKTYVDFSVQYRYVPLGNATTAYGTKTFVVSNIRHEFCVWDNDSQFKISDEKTGSWNYTFK